PCSGPTTSSSPSATSSCTRSLQASAADLTLGQKQRHEQASMELAETDLRFVWWNLQSFAHFDRRRVSEDQWPSSAEEDLEKCRRIDRVLRDMCDKNPPEVPAFAETTKTAVTDLRDRNRYWPELTVTPARRLCRALSHGSDMAQSGARRRCR